MPRRFKTQELAIPAGAIVVPDKVNDPIRCLQKLLPADELDRDLETEHALTFHEVCVDFGFFRDASY